MDMDEKKRISVSVRTLAERVLQSGDLSFGMAPQSSLFFEGSEAHRKHQGSQGDGYESEVSLSCELEDEYIHLTLQGRADGISHENDRQVLEEIKSVHCDLSYVENGRPEHWAQAVIYAAILCENRDLSGMGVRLVYIKLPEYETRTIEISPTLSELQSERDRLVSLFLRSEDSLAKHELARNAALGEMDFCFPDYRPGQRQMAGEVFRSVRDRVPCLLEAPTGIGKTAAALFGSLKALSQGMGEKIFYLAPRSTIKAVANDTLDRIASDPGFPLRRVTLTAKEKCCPQDETVCDPELCPYARGFFDRLDGALAEAETLYRLDEDAVRSLAEKHTVCPFELSLALAEISDIVICDYNYAFDPRVRLQRFFQDGGPYVLLVDEAHQLLDRSREMFSAGIGRDDVKKLKDALPKGKVSSAVKALRQTVRRFYAVFRAFSEELEESEALCPCAPSEELHEACEEYCENALPFLGTRSGSMMKPLTDLYFLCRHYLNTEKGFDERSRFLVTKNGRGIRAVLQCIDPSEKLKEASKKIRTVVCYSATLAPESYFMRLLGLQDAAFRRYPSPFDSGHLGVWVRTDIQTAYRFREESAGEVAQAIHTFVSAKSGHYMVFFPSYRYMEMVLDIIRDRFPDVPVWAQEKDMKEDERLDYLEGFRSATEETLVGFVVMGGFFAEGIDLPGDCLIGAVIVGAGIPQIGPERDLIRAYHDASDEPGYQYAYQFPGFVRVQQAAGRLIRTENDKGALLLIDPRFVRQDYLELMPASWFPLSSPPSDEAMKTELTRFWERT